MSSKLEVISRQMTTDTQPVIVGGAGRDLHLPKESDFIWSLITFGERVTALMLLLALFPLLVMIGLVIVFLSRRSPLVRHSRIGQYGRELKILKFRTMWNGSVSGSERYFFIEPIRDSGELQPKRQSDPRVTSCFASFCRRHSVDELPQLWHVIRGDMALIGPRPQTALELRKYYGAQAGRLLAVKPGLSGLWQVTGRSRVNREQRRKLDLFMVDNWSVRLYLHILNATIPTILSGRDAW
jgi:exopolysaccharide production protein ExoY